jgi:type IX secretion system PorP/SprF family membrane protein
LAKEIIAMNPIKNVAANILLIIAGSVISQPCAAQFIPYSQYNNARVLTNPSQAALVDHTEFGVHYRRSRIANYEIPSVSFVRPFYRRDALRAGGFGANLVSQQAGPGGAYKVMGILGTFAYSVHLSKTHHISAGLQGGIISKKIDPSGITTDQQFSFGAFDASLPTGENISPNSASKPVINAGFSWSLTNYNQAQKAMLGIALANMNRPIYELAPGSTAEKITYTITGEILAIENRNVSLVPTFRYVGGTNSFANIGTQLRYQLPGKNNQAEAGAWYKTTKAIVCAIQYGNDIYTLAASMDISAASDMQVNVNNAIEFSLTWKLKHKARVSAAQPSSVPPVAAGRSAIVPQKPAEEIAQEPLPVTQTVEPALPVPSQEKKIRQTLEEVKPDGISAAEQSTLQMQMSFEIGSSQVSRESLQFIETQLVPILKAHPHYRLHITGHSCTVGDKVRNEKISLSRAQAVAKILVQHGVPENQLIATGMDFQKPIATNDTEEGRQKNRRVEFELLKEE